MTAKAKTPATEARNAHTSSPIGPHTVPRKQFALSDSATSDSLGTDPWAASPSSVSAAAGPVRRCRRDFSQILSGTRSIRKAITSARIETTPAGEPKAMQSAIKKTTGQSGAKWTPSLLTTSQPSPGAFLIESSVFCKPAI